MVGAEKGNQSMVISNVYYGNIKGLLCSGSICETEHISVQITCNTTRNKDMSF